MLKLTLLFRGRPLAVHLIEGDCLRIGRDPDNDVFIDSLAVAPRHAELQAQGDGFLLVALDEGFPVLCNGSRVDRVLVHDGDLIELGKHTLAVNDVEREAILRPQPAMPRHGRRDQVADAPAFIQVQSGERIGQILPLTRSVTRLSRLGGHEVIVVRRGSGYCLARIGEANRVFVRRLAVRGDTEIPLDSGDEIEIDGVSCQFFCLTAETDQAKVAPALE